MYELIDENKNIKMMAIIICTFTYGNNNYCLYSIDRDKSDTNIFVSKLVTNSLGYTLDSNISEDELEALGDITALFLSKESLDKLREQGFSLTDLKLSGINKFNEKKCYITTCNKDVLKEVMLNYNLEIPNNNTPIIKVKKSKPINKSNIGSILGIILGVLTIIVCLLAIIKIIFH